MKVIDMINNEEWRWPTEWHEKFPLITQLEVPKLISIYSIWQERNGRIFRDNKRSCEELYKFIVKMIKSKLLGLTAKNSAVVKEIEVKWNISCHKIKSKNYKGADMQAIQYYANSLDADQSSVIRLLCVSFGAITSVSLLALVSEALGKYFQKIYLESYPESQSFHYDVQNIQKHPLHNLYVRSQSSFDAWQVTAGSYNCPVTNTGHSILPTHHRPLHLHNVLITPNIIKNLICVRQFTRDNNCTIEFDAFGFSVKDFLTRHILLRCDSSGDLYPVTKPSSLPSALMSLGPSTWHQRLGHPGDAVLHSLVSRNFISCKKEKSPHVCHAWQLGKHVKLPFSNSTSIVSRCLEIIHSDIWTSPIVSTGGFKYYVIFLK
ncbi:ribonuclease H-like domain-containing protein [Tanacetum coccineum]